MMGAYSLKKYDALTLDWIYEILPRLYERKQQLAGTLSGGEQQMLAIGRAIMQGSSSNGRASVSKTAGCGFESLLPCH